MDVPAENLPCLPFEIIVTILMLLPAEDLVRFMLVCREWRDLIKGADFILKHLKVSASRGNNYLLCGPQHCPPFYPFMLLSDKSHVKVLEGETQFRSLTGVCHPIYSSEGLLLLYDGSFKADSRFYLYNPFIQKPKSIGSPSLNIGEGCKIGVHCHIIGFGYQSQANDYKVVSLEDITYLELDLVVHSLFQLEVYSLRTDSWKRIEHGGLPKILTNWLSSYHIQNSSEQVVVHDCFHWLAYDNVGDESRLIAFDLGKEAFQAIRLPNYEIDEYELDKIVVYKDTLSLMVFHRNGLERCFSLWVLMEYGVFDSWSRLFTVAIDARIERPFTFTRHDELIFKQENFFVVHNLFTQKRQYFDTMDKDPYALLKFLPLTNSLTLIDSK